MERKDHIDLFGATALTLFSLHLAFNQVVIKVTAGGFEPIFAAGLRSAGAILVLLLWMRLRGIPLAIPRVAWPAGLLSGVLFATEFMFLFSALDLTTVSRASVIFYSMPVWLTLAAHVMIPGERLTRLRLLGLGLAVLGVAIALADRDAGQASWAGDLMALGAAICWAALALCVRVTPLSEVAPAPQLMCQVVVSAPLLLVVSSFLGPMIREVQPIHLAGMAFQIIGVASLGFMFWFWLMKIYPASGVASFAFLSPVFSVLLGWLLLSEEVGASIWIALVLVAAGIFMINRRPKAAARA